MVKIVENFRKLVILVCGIGVIYTISASVKSTDDKMNNGQHASSELNTIIESDLLNECYDSMMTLWFESFVEYQEKGLSISEADEKVSKEVIAFYSKCD